MKNTVSTFKEQKANGDKITMLTAYDYSTAKLVDSSGINGILVGDSLGMVMLGYEDTLSVTMEDMIHHTAAVCRGAKNALVVGDMPFMSYQVSVEEAVRNAGRLMKEGRCHAVKLEGGVAVCPQIKAITQASIPVMAHIGLTPQSVNAFGGFKVQGKSEDAARKLIEEAKGCGRSRRFFYCFGVCSGKTSGIDFKKRKYTYHRNRSRSRLRRTNFGLPRYAWYVLRFYTEICKEVRGNRRCNESGI